MHESKTYTKTYCINDENTTHIYSGLLGLKHDVNDLIEHTNNDEVSATELHYLSRLVENALYQVDLICDYITCNHLDTISVTVTKTKERKCVAVSH